MEDAQVLQLAGVILGISSVIEVKDDTMGLAKIRGSKHEVVLNKYLESKKRIPLNIDSKRIFIVNSGMEDET